MNKHSSQIRLVNAIACLRIARESCPHWDMESDGAECDCCYEVEDAKRELRLARKAAKDAG